MSWQDNRQKGSFRGVPFHSVSSDGQIGRDKVLHEFPLRQDAFADDMGPKAKTFTLTIFVIGDDYMKERDALEDAFNQEGPGELVHPWRGRMMVDVMDCKPRESIQTGGKQSWTVTFTQTGKQPSPTVRADTVAIVDSAADAAVFACEADFAEGFSVASLPEFVEADAITQINTILDNVLNVSRGMLPDMEVLPAFIHNASGILGKVTQLLRLPTNLASQMTGQIAGLLGLAQSPLAAFNTLKSLFSTTNSESPPTTPARIEVDNNRVAVANLTRRTAIIEAARSSALIEFESQNQALATRDALADAIETEQLTASDPVYATLADLRVAVVNDISTRANDLSRLMAYTPKATLPAVVLAYSIYGDAKKDADIISRNNIKHPGFVPGGKKIDILV